MPGSSASRPLEWMANADESIMSREFSTCRMNKIYQVKGPAFGILPSMQAHDWLFGRACWPRLSTRALLGTCGRLCSNPRYGSTSVFYFHPFGNKGVNVGARLRHYPCQNFCGFEKVVHDFVGLIGG